MIGIREFYIIFKHYQGFAALRHSVPLFFLAFRKPIEYFRKFLKKK